MEASVGTAYVDFEPDFSTLNKKVAAVIGPLTSKFGKLGAAGAAGLGVVAGGAVAAGAALYDVGEQFDQAYDVIRVKTGAVGKELGGLKGDFKEVVSDVPATFADAGTAVAQLSQRLDLTGRPLQNVSTRVLELSRLTETDLTGNIETVTRLFADWSVQTDQQPKTLDKLFRASQETGIEIGRLAEYMVQFGSPLRQMGFDFDTAAAMFSKFEKEGVNLQTAMPGLRMALKNFAAEGKDPADALEATIKKIEQAGSTAEANTMAFEVFGTRAGPDLAAAIREGRFDFDELISSIRGGKDTILGASKDTADLAEQWQLFKNRVMVRLEPLASQVFGAVGREMEKIGDILTDPTLSDEERFSMVFDRIADHASDAFSEIASQAGHFAPEAAEAFVEGFIETDAWGKIVIGTLLLAKLGGRGKITTAGASIGRWLGVGIAAGAASTAVGGAAGVGATAAAGGGIAGGILSKLRGIRWGRVGALGLGIALADNVTNEFMRRLDERSDDVRTALDAIGEKQGTVSFVRENIVGPYINESFGNRDVADEKSAAENLGAQYDELLHKRVQLSQATQESLRHQLDEVNVSKKARAELERMLSLTRLGSKLGVGIDLGMDPKKLREIRGGFQFLRRGIGTNMADISRVTQRTGRLIATTFGKDTKEGRRLAATNMRATASAIEQQMQRSGNKTKEGMERVRNLIRNANLIAPSRKQAQDFGREWARGMAQSKEATRQGIQGMINEAKRMPGPMRQVALQAWLEQAKQAKRSGDITAAEFRRMRSRVLSEFGSIQKGGKQQSKGLADGVIGNVSRLVNTTASALGIFRDNANAALSAYGVKVLEFTLQTAAGAGGDVKRQQGGIVPGSGDGDKFRTFGEAGAFVLNREATAAYGFKSGGMVPLALEAGERYFSRAEVASIGRDKLEAMNAAVPRFLQRGGGVDLPRPQLAGDAGVLRALGQAAIDEVYEGGKAFLDKHAFASGASGAGAGQFRHYPGLSGDTDFAIALGQRLSALAKATVGHISVTSGWRSRAEQAALYAKYGSPRAAPPGQSNHEDGKAADISPERSAYGGAEGRFGLNFPMSWEPWHVELMQLGGVVQRLLEGGWVHGSSKLSPDQLATLAHHVRAASPGLMSQIAMAESAGDPRAMGGAGDKGLWQIIPSTASAFGLDYDRLFDPLANARGMKKVLDGQGLTAWSTYNSGAYASQPKGQVLGPLDAASGGGGKEDVPATYRGLRTDSLSFGSMPKSLEGVKRELGERKGELRRYRAGATHARKEGKPAIERALRANIVALEGRIRELDHERAKLRREAAKRKFTKRLGRRFAKLTGFEDLIAAKERAYERKSQFAEQLVDLEPLMSELPASASDAQREAAEKAFAEQYASYVSTREEPAYLDLLGTVADWRNTILGAQGFAAGDWQKGKALGGLEGNWEDNILGLENQIEHISNLPKTHSKKWWNEHPKARRHMEEQLAKLPMLRFKERELRKVLGESREQFYPGKARVLRPNPPFAGSGAFEDALTNVQGVHWPDQHELLQHLPATRVAGMFGGVIWDVQTSIAELGMKIRDAAAGVGSGGGSDDSAQLELTKELLRQANQRNILRGIEERVASAMPPYAGMAHSGAIVPGPPTQESVMLVRGGERIRTPEQELALAASIRRMVADPSQAGGPKGLVIEELNFYKDGEVTAKIGGEEIEARVRAVNEKDGRRRARTVGRGLATAGRLP